MSKFIYFSGTIFNVDCIKFVFFHPDCREEEDEDLKGLFNLVGISLNFDFREADVDEYGYGPSIVEYFDSEEEMMLRFNELRKLLGGFSKYSNEENIEKEK